MTTEDDQKVDMGLLLRTIPEIEQWIANWPKNLPYPTIWVRTIEWLISQWKKFQISERSSVGDKIRQARVRQKLNQTQLATMAGVTQGMITYIESGKSKRPVKKETLEAIANALQIPSSYLIPNGDKDPV